jgi:ABC-type branched-subunit amino acid transport system substrate-binding protein
MVVIERRADLEDSEVLLPPNEEAEQTEEVRDRTENDLLGEEIKRERRQLARERRRAAKKHRRVDPRAVLSEFAPQTRVVDGGLADEKMFVRYHDHVVGPYEYERILSMILQDGRACPSGIDPQALYEAVLDQQYRCPHGYCYGYPAPQSVTSVGSTAASSFSYSFAPEPSTSTTNTFSTTAYPPSAQNTIVFDTTRDTAFHRTNASSYEIGALIPLSVNGTGLLSGVQFAESFRCAINLLNSNSRVLKNTLLTYLIQDTGVLPNVAVNQAYLLERRDLSMVIGPYDYDSLPPVANLYNNVSLPFISYGASGVQYSNGTVYPTFFRTIPSDLSTARAMAETMSLFGWGFVAAIFTTDSYGQSGRTALLQQIGRQRLKVTCVNQIDPGSTRGLANFADCMAQSEASVVVLWMNAENAANVVAFLYQNATNSRLTFMAPDRWALVNRPRAFNDTIPATNYTFPISYVEGTRRRAVCTH